MRNFSILPVFALLTLNSFSRRKGQQASVCSALIAGGFLILLATLPALATAQTSFGSVALGSSATAMVTVDIPFAGTLGTVAVLTQGAPNLEFTNNGGGSCTVGTAYTAGETCTVAVKFSPTHTGTRAGAVVLENSTGVLATAYLLGSGGAVSGPLANFLPGLQSAIGGGFLAPRAVAIDGSGNVYVTDVGTSSNPAVYKETLQNGSYTQSKIGSGFVYPIGVAVDGSGDVFIADELKGTVFKETPSGSGYTQTQMSGSFVTPTGLAVDGAGNLWISDQGSPSVAPKLLRQALTNGTYVQDYELEGGFTTPQGIAVDSAGNLYVADQYGQTVYKETLLNGTYNQSIFLSLAQPTGIAVDGNGNIYVAEFGGGTFLVELSSGGTYVEEPYGGYAAAPFSIAVDGSGNVYTVALGLDSAGDDYPPAVEKFTAALPPSLNFGSAARNGSDSNGFDFQTVTVANNGSAALNFSSVSYPTDFIAASSNTAVCTSSTSLVVSSICTLAIQFAPQESLGSAASHVYNEDVKITTNTGNVSGTVDTIVVTGTEVHQSSGTIVSTPNPAAPGATVTFTASVKAADGFTGEAPTGQVQFFIDNQGVGSAVALVNGVATYTTSTLSLGNHTALFYYTGDANYLNGYFYESGSETIVVPPPIEVANDTSIGNVNVGSSSPITVTVSFTKAETLSSIAVVTQRVAKLDFTNAGGGTCATGTAYAAGATCTVKVAFTPKYAGARYGAVVLTATTSGVVGTGFLQGTGVAPEIGYGPATTTAIAPTVSSIALSGPMGAAIDAAGNLFIADEFNNRVVEVPSGGGASIAIDPAANGITLSSPTHVAIDGAGDLFIADSGNSRVVEVPAGGAPATVVANAVYGADPGSVALNGLAVDGVGDLFISEAGYSNGAEFNYVIEVPANGAAVIIISPVVNGQGLANPQGLALDSAGDLFIVDRSNNRIVEVPAGDGAPVAISASDLSGPAGIAVDAAGDLFIADQYDYAVLEVPAGGGASIAIQPTVNGVQLMYPDDLALDSAGNLFIADANNNRLLEVHGSQAPSFAFAAAGLGTPSSDSPQTVTLHNIGNAPLLLPVPSTGDNPSISAGFTLNAGAAEACAVLSSGSTTAGTLASGTSCLLPISFEPVELGSVSGSLVVTDNSLNGSKVTQTIALSGTGEPATAAPVISPGAGSYTAPQSVKITDATSGATIYYTLDGTIPPGSPTTMTYANTPIAVSSNETINAVAAKAGDVQSSVVAATYTIDLPPAATPVISLASGEYTGTQTVTITDTTPGATLSYTTNGSYPTVNTAIQSAPLKLTISTSETLVVAAVAPGYSLSLPAFAEYYIQGTSTPFIYTVAGDGMTGYSGDGGPATLADINSPYKTVTDSAGNLYIADSGNNRVRKVTAATGVITTIAGTGIPGYSGDTKAATSAELNDPVSLAFDKAGNLYIADANNNVVRKIIMATGIITTVAGNGTPGYNGDGVAATAANLNYPRGLAFDAAGNLYISDSYNFRIRMVTANTGNISTVAGGFYFGYGGDGGLATDAEMTEPGGIAIDGLQNLDIADSFNSVIRQVNLPSGIITTVAGYCSGQEYGSCFSGFGGDGGAATSAELFYPQDVAVDNQLNLYIADTFNSVIREVTKSNGIINTIAGNSSQCFSEAGDGSVALAGQVCYPYGVSVDVSGNVYLANYSTSRIGKVFVANNPPTVSTAAPAFSMTGGTYAGPQTVTVTDSTPGASIYITLDGTTPNGASQGYFGPINVTGTVTIKAIAVAPGYLPSTVASEPYIITLAPSAVISTIAGNGVFGFSGEGGPATAAEVGNPTGIAVNTNGDVYFSDTGNELVWKVAAGTGIISIVAGNGTRGNSGNGGPATSAELSNPVAIALDSAGNLYIADANNYEIRMVSAATGTITTIAGNGTYGYSGDNGPATAAEMTNPYGLACDTAGNLYIADSNNEVIRKVNLSTGIISTFAGNGSYPYSGDGGQALAAGIPYPEALAVDGAGNLYIFDGSSRLRKVTVSTGIITTVAGNGDSGYSGDGGVATSAEISPEGIAIDHAGNLYLSGYSNSVRKVSVGTSIITTIAGNGYYGYNGDGLSATVALLGVPYGVALDASGNLYIADQANYLIRKVTLQGVQPVTLSPTSLAFGGVTVGTTSTSQQVTLTNNSTTALAITSIAVAGTNASSFVVGNSCGTSVAAGANCTIHGHFAPTVAGAQTAAITITDSATGSPQTVALTGTGADSTASLSASSLSYGIAEVGTTTAAQQVTLTNTGTAALVIGSITVTGPNASAFAIGNNCGTSVAVGASCIIHATFAPVSEGGMTATITINDGVSGSPQTVALTGTGVNPSAVTFSANSLSFGYEQVGVPTASQTVTMTNTGGSPLIITSIAVTGANASSFTFANSCGTSLAIGASCTIHGHFEPTALQAMTAAITITDSASGSPQKIALTGTGANPTTVTLSPSSLSFGIVDLGVTTASQSATLTNTGTTALLIGGMTVAGDGASMFVFANTCGTSLAVGASCTIHGHFQPTSIGAITAAITITDSATNSPQTIALTGTGVGATTVSLSSTSLSFGGEMVGVATSSQSVTLTNTGSWTLGISSIAVTGTNASSFAFGNTCGVSLAPAASCTIHGHFEPTAVGALRANITIIDTATGSPQSIALTGTGATTTTVSLSSTSLSFGYVDVGVASTPQSATLTNTGVLPLTISSIAVTGTDASSFVFSNNCGTTLAPGAGCTIQGHFTPAAQGTLTASVTLTDSPANSPQTIALSGTGVTPTTVTLLPATLSFGPETVGSSTGSQSATLTNTGTSTLGISSIVVGGANPSSFVMANSCGSGLAPGATCTIHGHFAPAATGSLKAVVTINDTASGSPQTLTLTGTGQ